MTKKSSQTISSPKGKQPNSQQIEIPSDLSIYSFILHIVNSKNISKKIAKIIFSALGLSIVFTFAIALLLFWALELFKPSLNVRVTKEGTVIFSTPTHQKTAFFQVSSNGGIESPWINTGIELTEDQLVTIQATGKICLAFHRMSKAAESDSLPPMPWNGPEGIKGSVSFPPRIIRTKNRESSNALVSPNSLKGMLIGCISNDIPNHTASENTQVIDIGKNKTFTANKTGTLWLTVNDIWLDQNSAKVYSNNNTEVNEKVFREKIIEKKYWNIWYDDNSGSYLVTIEVKDKL